MWYGTLTKKGGGGIFEMENNKNRPRRAVCLWHAW